MTLGHGLAPSDHALPGSAAHFTEASSLSPARSLAARRQLSLSARATLPTVDAVHQRCVVQHRTVRLAPAPLTAWRLAIICWSPSPYIAVGRRWSRSQHARLRGVVGAECRASPRALGTWYRSLLRLPRLWGKAGRGVRWRTLRLGDATPLPEPVMMGPAVMPKEAGHPRQQRLANRWA